MSSTRLIALHHREEIAAYLRQDPLLHVYAIGDLDDFFWPYTQWYGYEKDDALAGIALVYMGQATPTVLLFHRDTAELLEFVEHLQPHLPRSLYLHISPGCTAALRPHYTLEEHGTHCRMGLTHQDALDPIDTHDTARLEPSDIDAIWQLNQQLGFSHVAHYEEYLATPRR